MILMLFSLWGAFWNRARGSQIYGFCHSTTEGRIISMLMLTMAVCLFATLHNAEPLILSIIVAWCFGTLMLWCTPAWEKYTSAAMGMPINVVTDTGFAPVDFIMKILWAKPLIGWQLRLWGLIATSLRMSLIAPCFLGLSYISGNFDLSLALGGLAFGLPYYVFAYIFPNNQNVTMYSELSVGSMIGALLLKSIGGA